MRVISHVSVGYAIVMKYRKTLRKTAAACLLEVREMNLRGRRYARGSITYSRLSYNVGDCRNFCLPADTPCTRRGLIKITQMQLAIVTCRRIIR